MLFFVEVFRATLIFGVCFALRVLFYNDDDPSKPHLNLRGNASVNSSCAHPPPAPGTGHLQTPAPFPNFWHACGFLSEYNYTEDFTKKQIGSSVKNRKKLKRVVKAGSRFYACISSSLYINPQLQSEIRSYGCENVNQRFLVIESNFFWYYLKNILPYL